MEDTSAKVRPQGEWYTPPEVLNFWEEIERRKWQAFSQGPLGYGDEADLADEGAGERGEEWESHKAPKLPETGSAEGSGLFTCSIEKSCGPKNHLDPVEVLAGEDASPGECKGVQAYEIRPVRCQSPACPTCAPSKAFRLSVELAAELETFQAPQLWTLTIDPKACPDPRRIYEHLKDKRAVGELVRTLFEAGHLATRRYFAAYEFQQGKRKEEEEGGEATEQLHIHLLIDTQGFVPFRDVQERWNRFLPDWAVELEGNRQGRLGGVNFEPVDNSKGMAIYATKYVGKGPKEGLPGWFVERLDEGRNCTLYSTSKGFWTKREKKVRESESKKPAIKRERVKLAERLEKCGSKASLMRVTRWATMGIEGWVSTKYEYIGRAGYFFDTAARLKATREEIERRCILIKQTHNDGRVIYDRGWDIHKLAAFLEEPPGEFVAGRVNLPWEELSDGLRQKEKRERYRRIRAPEGLAGVGRDPESEAIQPRGLVSQSR